MRRTNRAQLGCLTLLLLWAAVGGMFQVFHLWHNGGPGDNEGGGPFAAVGLVGFVAFFVIFATLGVVRWLRSVVAGRGGSGAADAPERQPGDA